MIACLISRTSRHERHRVDVIGRTPGVGRDGRATRANTRHDYRLGADPAPSPDRPALSLRGLTKRFGSKLAVDALDLDVPPGRMFGLVGPNGAGKTTTLSMASGLLRPGCGPGVGARARTCGRIRRGEGGRRRAAGRAPPLRSPRRRRTPALHRPAPGLPSPDLDSRIPPLLDALGLTEDANTLVVDYSAGMKKKIGLACALVHAPRLLILDEPFEAVDPVSGEVIREILRDYVLGGGTVVLSSHVMELVERLCDDVAVVADGRVLAVGPVAEVSGGSTLQRRFLELVGVRPPVEGTLDWLGPDGSKLVATAEDGSGVAGPGEGLPHECTDRVALDQEAVVTEGRVHDAKTAEPGRSASCC